MNQQINSKKNEQYELLVHEFSNPLTIAKSLVEIMIKDSDVQKLDEILLNINRMESIVEKFKLISDE